MLLYQGDDFQNMIFRQLKIVLTACFLHFQVKFRNQMKLTLEDDRSQSESNTDVSDGETVLGRKLMIMNYGEAVMAMNLFIQIYFYQIS